MSDARPMSRRRSLAVIAGLLIGSVLTASATAPATANGRYRPRSQHTGARSRHTQNRRYNPNSRQARRLQEHQRKYGSRGARGSRSMSRQDRRVENHRRKYGNRDTRPAPMRPTVKP